MTTLKSDREQLTEAQRLALEVLAEAGKPVGGWKYKTRPVGGQKVARVNLVAVGSLVKLGLAQPKLMLYTFGHAHKYEITDAGRAAIEELIRV